MRNGWLVQQSECKQHLSTIHLHGHSLLHPKTIIIVIPKITITNVIIMEKFEMM